MASNVEQDYYNTSFHKEKEQGVAEMTQELISAIFEQAPFGYAFHRLVLNERSKPEDYVFLDVNPAFEQMTRLKRKDIIGKGVTEVIPGIRSGNMDWVALYGQMVATGRKEQFTQYAEPLGRWYKVTAFATDKEHFVTIFQDVTLDVEHTQSLEKQKQEIKELSRDLELIFQTTQDAMFLARVEGGEFRYVRNNIAHQRLIGYSPEDIANKTPIELLGQELGQALEKSYQRCVDTKGPVTYEETLTFPAGTRDWLVSLSPLLDEGEVRYIVGARKDITLQKQAEAEREEFLTRLQTMFNRHDAVMLLIEPVSGKIVDANPAAVSFYGYSREELLNMCIQDINQMPTEEVKEFRMRAAKEKQRYFLFPHRLKTGDVRLVDVYSCPIVNAGQRLLFSIIFDATEREQYREKLYLEKEILKTTLLSIGDGMVTTDKEGRITAMNMVAETITGWKQEEARGRFFHEVFRLVNEETGQEVENPVARVLQTGKIIGLANHTLLITEQGGIIPIADSAAPIKDEKDDVYGVVMVFRDVTKEREYQQEILRLSYHDPLTGLYNRRFAQEEIKRLEGLGHLPLAVIMGDVNGLKLVNDIFGHQEGDRLLERMAKILKQNCRKTDIIARWGGDEFLILLPQTETEAAEKIVRRIEAATESSNDPIMNVNIALGFAIREGETQDFEEVLKEAEDRMYRQKLLMIKSYRNTLINTMLATLYEKSTETEQHAMRLKEYSLALGQELNLSARDLDDLALLSMLHDIGKIGVDKNILNKPEPLTPAEWAEIKKHPEIGYRIASNTPELSTVAEYILYHHERWDGRGYPQGLKGEEIPLHCRILALADSFDAMTNDRPYRKALSKHKAVEELRKNAGTQFDPHLTEIFVRLVAGFPELAACAFERTSPAVGTVRNKDNS